MLWSNFNIPPSIGPSIPMNPPPKKKEKLAMTNKINKETRRSRSFFHQKKVSPNFHSEIQGPRRPSIPSHRRRQWCLLRQRWYFHDISQLSRFSWSFIPSTRWFKPRSFWCPNVGGGHCGIAATNRIGRIEWSCKKLALFNFHTKTCYDSWCH